MSPNIHKKEIWANMFVSDELPYLILFHRYNSLFVDPLISL